MKTKLFALLVLLFSCAHEKQNVINGKIDGLEIGDKIFLCRIEDMSFEVIDSAIVSKVGEFTLKTKITGEITYLFYNKNNKIFNPNITAGIPPEIFLEDYANIDVVGDTKNWILLKITGGLYDYPDMQEINHLVDSSNYLINQSILLYEEFELTQDTTLLNKATLMAEDASDLRFGDSKLYDLSKKFIEKHPDMAYSKYLSYSYNENDTDESNIDIVAPDFTLKALDGQEITLSKFKGKYVLIDFWGSWCPPCRESSPKLVELNDILKKNNINVEFISIAINDKDDEIWKKAIEEDKLTWIQLNDSHSEKGKTIAKQYNVYGVPNCFLISPEGKILYNEHPLNIIPKVKEIFEITE
ncbi:MAG: AhpC/TSA family protein [Prevotellaceae bacterium]|jgi:thiol-disulfide isomerase/thioredoxin|nr:AhpC/TSA family protein [Prevotellaceae bacterium]